MNGKAVGVALVAAGCVTVTMAFAPPGPIIAAVVIIVGALLALAIVAGTWHSTATKNTQAALAGSDEYRALADEYRRLSELAITAQEHSDLKLGEISAQLDYLREQNASLQKILRDVE